MRLGVIIFDLDGTLVDSADGIQMSVDRAVQQVFEGRVAPDIRSRIGPPIRRIFSQSLQIEDEDVLTKLEQQFRFAYDSDGWKKTALYPGLTETLKELTTLGLKMFVLTNKPGAITGQILHSLSIADQFVEVLSLDSMASRPTSKAEAAGFLSQKY